MAALFRRRKLVFEVHTGGASANHVLHQLEGIEIATEAGLGVRHDRCVEAALKTYPGVAEFQRLDQGWSIHFSGEDEALAALLTHLVERQIQVTYFGETASNLETVFMQITNGEPGD